MDMKILPGLHFPSSQNSHSRQSGVLLTSQIPFLQSASPVHSSGVMHSLLLHLSPALQSESALHPHLCGCPPAPQIGLFSGHFPSSGQPEHKRSNQEVLCLSYLVCKQFHRTTDKKYRAKAHHRLVRDSQHYYCHSQSQVWGNIHVSQYHTAPPLHSPHQHCSHRGEVHHHAHRLDSSRDTGCHLGTLVHRCPEIVDSPVDKQSARKMNYRIGIAVFTCGVGL